MKFHLPFSILLTLQLTALTSCSRKVEQLPASPAPEEKSERMNTDDLPEDQELALFLERFHENPREVMDETPSKTRHRNLESMEDMSLENKGTIRSKIMRAAPNGPRRLEVRAAATSSDMAEALVDNPSALIKNLQQMDQNNLSKATLAVQPWSDDYWAIKKGIIGYRYADSHSPKEGSWKDFSDFSLAKPVEQYLQANESHLLSPSEKYDLLVGDVQGTMTSYVWDQGRQYFERDGKVEDWMGICHGWAPASYRLPRALKKVSVKSAKGNSIDFYPADIKALGSFLWAQTEYPTRFVGGRCDVKDPQKDQNGRIIDPKCFDTNPGTFHKAIFNLIGVQKQSFVMDATFDYEVWNQPILGYSYAYFNPQSGKTSIKAQDSTIALSAYTKDKFPSFRSSQAHSIVGVQMKVSYMVETTPVHRTSDAPQQDAVTSATYNYDLELDEQGNIIGGEWYSNKHPDFLWTPDSSAKAAGPYENSATGAWNIQNDNLPQSWAQAAKNSSKNGRPLSKIVEQLIALSQGVSVPAPTPAPTPLPLPDPTPVPAPIPNPSPVGQVLVIRNMANQMANETRQFQNRLLQGGAANAAIMTSVRELTTQVERFQRIVNTAQLGADGSFADSSFIRMRIIEVYGSFQRVVIVISRSRPSPLIMLDFNKIANILARLKERMNN